ncbi:MAG: CusA/CzcA family heavy metal efflux RND transporter [Candidatus Eremiobacteraeota bacterium]|nr:CusA/CzcA family heavy metal efflux RND transporter [Candidatus Eremiobacteraeota bacterium]
MLEKIIFFCLSQRWLMVFVALLLVALGAYSIASLSTDAFPDVTGVQVEIISKVAGKSPPELERTITTPLEIALRGIPGLTLIRSVSRPGISVITAVFEEKTDIYFARSQVLERLIEAKDELPAGTETSLGPISTAMGEIYQYTLEDASERKGTETAGERLMRLRTLQDWVISPVLKNVRGVSEIDPFGGAIKQYQVIINPDKLKKYGLSLRSVYEAIESNNSDVGGEFIEEGDEAYLVRGTGLVQSLEDIRNITLASEAGAHVLISDVAEVKEGEAVRHGAAIKDGKGEIVGASVLMLQGGNSRLVVKAVKEKVKEINEGGLLPEGVSIRPYYDRSEIVKEASHTLGKALIEGIILIVIVLYFFLRTFRGPFIIITAMLLSMLGAAAVMKLAGMTANLMTLGGLIISLGMIIDSAIIQTENVQRHLTGKEAESIGEKLCIVQKAVLEVRKPSILGELIIALTFLPILALEGMEGKMFTPLAVTVFIALMVSLFLSVFIIPVICLLALKPLKESSNALMDSLRRAYGSVLTWCLSRPRLLIFAALALMAASIALIPFVGTEFLPVMDEGAFDMDSVLLPGTSLSKSIEVNSKVQEIVKGFPELDTVVSKLGWSGTGIGAKDMDSGASVGKLKPRHEWKNAKTREELMDKMRDALAKLPGVLVSFSQPIQCRIDELVAGTKSQVVIKLFGSDLNTLEKVASDITREISGVKGTKDLIMEQVKGQQYIIIRSNRAKMAQFGINVRDIQDIVEIAVGGKAAGKFYEGTTYFDIAVRCDEKSRNDIKVIGSLPVDVPGQEFKVPLKEVADIVQEEGPVQISHENGQRKILIQCNISGRDIGSFVRECRARIKEKVAIPAGYYLEWGGQFENQEKAFKKLSLIVPVAVCIIFLLLFATFGSLRMALLVLLTLPCALIGGVFALFISGSYLSVPASIGFIALFGIAVLNGLVLMSSINQLREEGLPPPEAIQKGCETRIRPVLMTAGIAVFSLIPLLFSTGPGSEVQKPLAIVVVGGLITSTFMSVFLLPVLYQTFIGRDGESAPACSGD